jgi:hypothetical protein
MTCTSKDFIHWTDPVYLEYPNVPPEHLYTNQIVRYHRAPHIYLGFPKRFLPQRPATIDHPLPGVSDSLLMSSRDGNIFHRWQEAFIRPGIQSDRWVCRNNPVAWGLVETQSELKTHTPELSLYVVEGYYQGRQCRLRRYTLRLDGFVSVYASMKGGELVTKPIRFSGNRLNINFSTSAAGSVQVELQDRSGHPISGYKLDESNEIYGDAVEHTVTWKKGPDVSRLAGELVRLRFVLKDADVFAFRFVERG